MQFGDVVFVDEDRVSRLPLNLTQSPRPLGYNRIRRPPRRVILKAKQSPIPAEAHRADQQEHKHRDGQDHKE